MRRDDEQDSAPSSRRKTGERTGSRHRATAAPVARGARKHGTERRGAETLCPEQQAPAPNLRRGESSRKFIKISKRR